MKKKFRVVLPIELDGVIYQFGAEVELEPETAEMYSHAIQAVAEKSEE